MFCSFGVTMENRENKYLQLEDGTLLEYTPEDNMYKVVTAIQQPPLRAPSPAEDSPERTKLWTYENTKFLIHLVTKHQSDFDKTTKKVVWKKIADAISDHQGVSVTPQQCDTKYKCLIDTYRKTKKHNETSGNTKKNWIFYEEMDEILHKKPEITPEATCSNFSGLKRNRENANRDYENTEIDEVEPLSSPGSTSGSSGSYVSNFKSKRTADENTAERRHKEKMSRQDKFLDLFQELVAAVKKENKDE